MAQRDYSREAITSERAYGILRCVARNGPISPTEIADDIESSSNTVTNYISGLKDKNFLKLDSKQGRSKKYSIDYEGFADYFIDYWEEKKDVHFKTMSPSDELALRESNYPVDEVLDNLDEEINEEQNEELTKIIGSYVTEFANYYLLNVDNSTIRRMVKEDFASATLTLFLLKDNTEEMPNWLFAMFMEYYPVMMRDTSQGKAAHGALKAFQEVEEDIDFEEN